MHCRRGDRVNLAQYHLIKKNFQKELDLIINWFEQMGGINFHITICTEIVKSKDIIEVVNSKDKYKRLCTVRNNRPLINDIMLMSLADVFISCGSSVSVWALYLNRTGLKINKGTYHYSNYDDNCFLFNNFLKNKEMIKNKLLKKNE